MLYVIVESRGVMSMLVLAAVPYVDKVWLNAPSTVQEPTNLLPCLVGYPFLAGLHYVQLESKHCCGVSSRCRMASWSCRHVLRAAVTPAFFDKVTCLCFSAKADTQGNFSLRFGTVSKSAHCVSHAVMYSSVVLSVEHAAVSLLQAT